MNNGKFLKVRGWDNLARDPSSGAIVNVSSDARDAWKAKRKKAVETEERISSLEKQIEDMSEQIEAQSVQMEKVLGSLETLLNIIKQQNS